MRTLVFCSAETQRVLDCRFTTCSTISTRPWPDRCSELSLDLQAHCSATLVSRLLRLIHDIGFCGFHVFAQKEIEDVVFDVDWSELFSSAQIHQYLEVHPHFMANFAGHWNHEATVGSQIEILSSFARDFSSTAHHFVYTSESSVQRSTQTVFIVTLTLPNFTIKDTLTTGCSTESSNYCSIWFQWKFVHCSSCVQVPFHPFKPLRTGLGTESKPSK